MTMSMSVSISVALGGNPRSNPAGCVDPALYVPH